MVERVTVQCHECGIDLAGDSPDLRLELTDDDEPIVYCHECWGGSLARRRLARSDGARVGRSLRQLAEENEPPVDLDSLIARLRQSGLSKRAHAVPAHARTLNK
jgi:hypothetical protein